MMKCTGLRPATEKVFKLALVNLNEQGFALEPKEDIIIKFITILLTFDLSF